MSVPQSLVLITVDCLRADHVGFLGYDRPTTPFLDSLAAESTVFHNAIAAGVPTYYSFPAIMASRYPLALGRDVIGLAPGEPTLASTLQEAGYATAAFVAGNPYLSKRFGYAPGFEQYEDFLQGGIGLDPSPSQPTRLRSRVNSTVSRFCHKVGPLGRLYDELYFQYCQRVASDSQPRRVSISCGGIRPRMLLWIAPADGWKKTSNRPVFLWLHFMDPHAPFYPPPEALTLMKHPEVDLHRALELNLYWNRGDLKTPRLRKHRDDVICLYDAGIRWVDEQVKRLMTALSDLGFGDRCTLALTADHGEEFLDHDGRFHSPANVHEDLVRVPLLIRAAQPMAGKVEAPFSLLHLAPTLLDLLDVSAPGEFLGRSGREGLRNGKLRGDTLVAECIATCANPVRPDDRLGPRVLVVREARYKLIFDFQSKKGELFDLETDPDERHPLSASREAASAQRRLLQAAQHHLRNSRESRDQALRLAARLQDLGQGTGTGAG